jgi:hypothetical protein
VGEEAIGSFRLRGPVAGMATVECAEVSREWQRKGIATTVYDLIERDLKAGDAVLWPMSPAGMPTTMSA